MEIIILPLNTEMLSRHGAKEQCTNSFSNSAPANFDLSVSITQLFGNTQIQVDASPVRLAVSKGDVNQDGAIDLSDGSLIDNDAFNFA